MAVNNRIWLPGDIEQVRFAVERLPFLWEPPGTALYIGANTVRWHLGPELARAGHEITILEIWRPNCEYFLTNGSPARHVLCGDVREVLNLALPHCQYDLVVWWHGPEHVKREEVEPTLEALEFLARRAVLLGLPWGEYPQGAYPNPHEAHLCLLDPSALAELGYQVAAIGCKDDKETGRLVAWRSGDA